MCPEDLGHSPQDRVAAIRRTGRIYPAGHHAEIMSAELTGAPEPIAAALEIEAGSPVIRRHRVTYHGETPISRSVSWFHGDLADPAPGLLRVARIPLGTPGYIEQRTGRAVRRGTDQLAAAAADKETAADLGVPPGSPVLIGRNWYRDAEGEIIEYGEYASIAGRWQTYEYETAEGVS
jgi:DNA-binding GntR family transcriptional regulator